MRLSRPGILRVLAFVALGTLAGCGADGEPVRPSLNAGVGVSPGGETNLYGGVGLSKGPVSLFFGF